MGNSSQEEEQEALNNATVDINTGLRRLGTNPQLNSKFQDFVMGMSGELIRG